MQLKKLICDVCGGQIEMQSGGKGICTSCGTPYSAEIIKDKIQEIRGTVKIDGAVETVKGNAEKERLFKNAENLMRLKQYSDAKLEFESLCCEYSDDWRTWFGCYRAQVLLSVTTAEYIDTTAMRAVIESSNCTSEFQKAYDEFWRQIPEGDIWQPENKEIALSLADKLTKGMQRIIVNRTNNRSIFTSKNAAFHRITERMLEEQLKFFSQDDAEEIRRYIDQYSTISFKRVYKKHAYIEYSNIGDSFSKKVCIIKPMILNEADVKKVLDTLQSKL